MADNLRAAPPEMANSLPNLLHSTLRDVIDANHDQDARTFNWIFHARRTIVRANLAILEISNNNQKISAHAFSDCPGEDNCLFAVDFLGYVRWGKPTEYCTPIEWEKWTDNVDEVVYYDMRTAMEYAVDNQHNPDVTELTECRICGD